MSHPTDPYSPASLEAANSDTLVHSLKKINALMAALVAAGGGGGGTTPDPVTPNFFLLGASGSHSIPSGAKGWTVAILSGTGTIGGKAVPAGFSDGSEQTLAAAIVVTTDGSSSAYLRWNT